MIATAEAWRATVPTVNFRQRKMLSRSARDRRKPLYQAVSTSLLASRKARTAAWLCIKNGKNIDPAGGTGTIAIKVCKAHNR